MSKANKIYYQRNFPIGQFLYEHIGIELIVEQGKTVDETIKEARELVFENHKKNNPQVEYSEIDIPITKLVSPVNEKDTKPKTQEEKIIDDIATVTDPKVLDGYQFISKKYPSIKEAVENKRKELTA